MSATPQPPRGMQDLLPPVAERFQMHEQRTGALFERAGYRRIITPMFEDTALFLRGVGESSDIVNKEMYTFTDRSENSLTLRPEGTAPVMRAVLSNNLHSQGLPIKVWYSAAMFRYDRPQKGRYRQHHQLGIEAIGSDDPAIDAEVIAIAQRMLDGAGVTGTRLLLNSIGHPGCRADYMPKLTAFLEARRERLDEDCKRRMEQNPLRVFDCKNEDDQKILADAPTIEQELCADCRAHFDAVQAHLRGIGIEFVVAPRLVRGLDYYTRTAFEFQTDLLEAAQSTVCGGGRYDLLSESIGGPPLRGIGFGSGIERILIAQEAAGNAPPAVPLECFVIALGEDERDDAWRLVWALRDAGRSADLPFAPKSFKAGLKHADRVGARYAALIGPSEREAGACAMRDMSTGEQVQVPLDEAATWLKEKTTR
ncbi:MAG TPA: histidine--tRNA ligase [Actinomycetota bacterium]|nr:histidine--tRNA ligase [Actinomycetota bacterium]